jgi:TetR/AcrR family transcriptional regulator
VDAQGGNKTDASAQANLLMCYVIGRWHQFAKSGFKRKPLEFATVQLTLLNI